MHAFLWQNGTMTDLGTLGGTCPVPLCVTVQAVTINRKGQVAGRSVTALGEEHAFFWEDGTMTDLGTLGGTFSQSAGRGPKRYCFR